MSKKNQTTTTTTNAKGNSKAQSKREAKIDLILEKWPDQRKVGKRNYILKFGIVNWGISTFAIYWILMTVTSYLTDQPQVTSPTQLGVSLLFFIAFGILGSSFVWYRNETFYKERNPYKK